MILLLPNGYALLSKIAQPTSQLEDKTNTFLLAALPKRMSIPSPPPQWSRSNNFVQLYSRLFGVHKIVKYN